MRKIFNFGFTLVELVIVIAVISIVSAVLIPVFVSLKEAETEQVMAIYNGQEIVRLNEDGETIDDYEGMELYEIKSKDGKIYMYYRGGKEQ